MGDPKCRPFPESLVHGDLSQRDDKERSSRTDRESVPGGREERRGRLPGKAEHGADGGDLSLTGRMECFTAG